MKNSNFRPTTREIDDVTNDARRGARRGAIAGGLTGGVGASLYLPKSTKAKLIGAGLGAIGGNIAGRKIGRKKGAEDVVKSRGALLRQMARRLSEKMTQLESRYRKDDVSVDRNGNQMVGGLSGQDRNPYWPRPRGIGQCGDGVDAEQQAKFTAERQRLIEIFGHGIVDALDDTELSEEACAALRAALMARADSANGYGKSDVTFARKFFAAEKGRAVVDAMRDAEVMAHYLSAKRNGLIQLDQHDDAIDFGIDFRPRNQDGQFEGGSGPSAGAIQRAYNPNPCDRATGKNVGIGAGAAAAGLGAAVLAAKKFRKLPARLTTSGKVVDATASPVKSFARRNMTASPFPGGPKKLIRRMRRNRRNFALLINDPDFPLLPIQQPKLPNGTYQRVPVAKTKAEVLARLRKLTEWSRRYDLGAGSLAAGLIDGAIDAAGLGGATKSKKPKKLVLDADGNPYNPNFLPDPGTTTTSSFSAIGRIGSVSAKYAPDALTIGAADLTAEELHDAIQTAKKKKKQKALVNGGIEQESGVPGNGPTALSLRATLTEFDSDGARDRARKRAGELGAAGVGGVAGAYAGLRHDQGRPVRPKDIRPGDVVYRRFGPASVLQHHGVVGEDGKVTHRSAGSSQYRAIKPESFRKIGKGATYREARSSDHLPPKKAARNASKAAGTVAGCYGVGRNDCQSASSRLATRRVPGTGQLRRAGIGAGVGALAAGAAAHILQNRKKDQ
jgi:hypothetical protein